MIQLDCIIYKHVMKCANYSHRKELTLVHQLTHYSDYITDDEFISQIIASFNPSYTDNCNDDIYAIFFSDSITITFHTRETFIQDCFRIKNYTSMLYPCWKQNNSKLVVLPLK